MIDPQRLRGALILIGWGFAGALVAAWLQLPTFRFVLPDEANWLMAYWSVSAALLAVVVALAVERLLAGRGGMTERMAVGAIIFPLLLAALASPALLCLFAVGSENLEPSCDDTLSFLAIAVPTAGVIFGASTGLLAWTVRLTWPRRG